MKDNVPPDLYYGPIPKYVAKINVSRIFLQKDPSVLVPNPNTYWIPPVNDGVVLEEYEVEEVFDITLGMIYKFKKI